MNRWNIKDQSEHYLNLESPCGYWRAYIRWDGCLDVVHSNGMPIDECDPAGIQDMHVCDVAEFIARLGEVCALAKKYLPNTDAAENAQKISSLTIST
jgi:hypothetical protein